MSALSEGRQRNVHRAVTTGYTPSRRTPIGSGKDPTLRIVNAMVEALPPGIPHTLRAHDALIVI